MEGRNRRQLPAVSSSTSISKMQGFFINILTGPSGIFWGKMVVVVQVVGERWDEEMIWMVGGGGGSRGGGIIIVEVN